MELSSKLINLLRTFDRKSWDQLLLLLESPYFNRNKNLVRLATVCERFLQRDRTPPTKVAVWKKVFPKQSYDDDHMRRYCSELTRFAQDLLVYQGLETAPERKDVLLLPHLNRSTLQKHFTYTTRKLRQDLEKRDQLDADYHLTMFQCEREEHIFEENKFSKRTEQLDHLHRADLHLDAWYYSNKLKHYCDALAYQRRLPDYEPNIHLPPDWLSLLEDHPVGQYPAVRAYVLTALLLLQPEQEENYVRLKDYLEKHYRAFGRKELDTLYIHLKNYCIIYKINNGHSEYFRELFHIFRTLLEREIIIGDGLIAPQDYKNIITVGLHVQEYDWVENFIQNYTDRLPAQHQDNALNYNLAKVYFSQRQYDKVIGQLREVEYKNEVYALGGKLMLLKTYYETEEIRALDSLIDSFRIYLRRNRRIARDVRQQYLNVLRFVKKLASVAPYDHSSLRKIREQIETCKALADKKWILAKLEEREQ